MGSEETWGGKPPGWDVRGKNHNSMRGTALHILNLSLVITPVRSGRHCKMTAVYQDQATLTAHGCLIWLEDPILPRGMHWIKTHAWLFTLGWCTGTVERQGKNQGKPGAPQAPTSWKHPSKAHWLNPCTQGLSVTMGSFTFTLTRASGQGHLYLPTVLGHRNLSFSNAGTATGLSVPVFHGLNAKAQGN